MPFCRVLDLCKDIYYAVVFEHNRFAITFMLWIFSLFGMVYGTIVILVMSQKQLFDMYENSSGNEVFKEVGYL